MHTTPRHFALPSITFIFVTVLTSIASISCAPAAPAASAQKSSNLNDATSISNPTTPSNPQTGEVPLENPALWEQSVRDGHSWSSTAASIIKTSCPAMMDGAKDMDSFCPRYSSLSQNQKINVWVYLVSAIAKYESAFNPTSRLKEPGMGTDPITGLPVYSEGLLQLSYQDQIGYPFCKIFDWQADKHLSATDPRKTILNPENNLECGIQILNHQIQLYDQISIDSGTYWSTLRSGGRTVASIKALVKAMPLCK